MVFAEEEVAVGACPHQVEVVSSRTQLSEQSGGAPRFCIRAGLNAGYYANHPFPILKLGGRGISNGDESAVPPMVMVTGPR